MKKYFILLNMLLICSLANSQAWFPLLPSDSSQISDYFLASQNPSLALDSNGTPYIAYIEYSDSSRIVVKKYNGSIWEKVGIGNPSGINSTNPKLGINPSGEIYLAFKEYQGGIRIKKINGSSWVNVGNLINGNSLSNIVFDSIGSVYIASTSSDFTEIYVYKNNNNNWQQILYQDFGGSRAENISLIIDNNNNNLYLGYNYSSWGGDVAVRKFDGTTWTYLGNTGTNLGYIPKYSFAFNNTGTLYLVGSSNGVKLKKYTGNQWIEVGNYSNLPKSIKNISLFIDSLDVPIIMFFNDSINVHKSIFAKRLLGSNWIDIVSPIIKYYSGNTNVSFAISKQNTPNLLYQEEGIELKKYINNSWQNVGTKGIANEKISNYSFALDSIGANYVFYSNNATGNIKKYFNNTWVSVGNSNIPMFGGYGGVNIAIDRDGVLYITYNDTNTTGDNFGVKKFSGNSWVNIGAKFGKNAKNVSIKFDNLNTPYVLYCNYNYYDYSLYLKKYVAGNWVTVGTYSIANEYISDCSLYIDQNNNPWITYKQLNVLYITKFNQGGYWEDISTTGLNYSNNYSYKIPIVFDINGNPIILFLNSNNKLRVKKFIGNTWNDIDSTSLSSTNIVYSPDLKFDNTGILTLSYLNNNSIIIKQYNGVNWVNNTSKSLFTCSNSKMEINKNNDIVLYYIGPFGYLWAYQYISCGNPAFGGLITTNQNFCSGATPSLISNVSLPNTYVGTLEYKWQYSTVNDSSMFYDISGATSLNYQPPYINQTTWYRRLAKVSCKPNWNNAVSSNITKINISPLPSPASIISGQNTVCINQSLVSYSISAINNATSYNWTLPPGATGNSTTNSINVDYGNSATSGNISVYGINSCGNGIQSSLPINVDSISNAADTISGNTAVLAGQQNVFYSIPSIPNTTNYTWDVPAGVSLNTYSGNAISVNFSQAAVSGNISVYGSNICGDGVASSLYVTVNPLNPNCSAQFDLVADTTTPHNYFAVNNASGVPPLQYNWSWGDGSFSTTAYPTHTYNVAGNYKICLAIIDSVGCTTTYCDSSYLQKDPNAIISVQVIPQGTLGISSLLSDKIKIYPNPAKDNLIIELIESNISQNSTISIYNIQGQLCRQILSNQSKTEIDIKDLSTGLYFVKLNNEKEIFVSRFVKE